MDTWTAYRDWEAISEAISEAIVSFNFPEGIFLLGQKLGASGYEADYAFKGLFNEVNVWTQVLDKKSVRLLFLTCGWAQGDNLEWKKFRNNKSGVKISSIDYPRTRGNDLINMIYDLSNICNEI